MKNIQSIKNNKLFSGVSESVITSFFDPKEFIEINEGKIIYKTGDESTSLFLIIRGDVKVKFSSNNYVSSRIFNDFFGEKELIDNTRRISSAVAFSKLVVYRLDVNILKNLISKNTNIQSNIRKYGELKLPEINNDSELRLSITERKKPVKFRAGTHIGNQLEEEKENRLKNDDQLLSDSQPISEILSDKGSAFVEPGQYGTTEELPNNSDSGDELKKMLLDDPEDFKNWQFTEEAINKSSEISQSESESGSKIENSEPKIPSAETEAGINREYIRKILGCIEIINSGITIEQLVSSVAKAVKILTQSEASGLILIDEKLSVMRRFAEEGNKSKEEHFQFPEGLTGTSALQKKILNFERPTEDSRFNADIDQPGSAGLKRILYFPVINESGETIAVLQLARENKKFTDEDISSLNMVVRQIENAIGRSKGFEELIRSEKELSNKRIKNLVIEEIRRPLNIINDYVEILSAKNLSQEETDEIIMMMQKQANSVEDIASTIFNCTIDSLSGEIKLDRKEIHFNEFIHDILELLSEYCESQEIKLFKKIGDGAVVNIDRAKFYTAIYQIIRLCCNDSRKGSKIYFSSELKDDTILIIIKDEGKGSLGEVQGDIADYLNSKYELGPVETSYLMSKKIILTHEGQFHIESTTGNGTTFTITLPISSE